MRSKFWSPLKLWVLAAIVLGISVATHIIGLEKDISVTIILVSFLLYAAGNPLLNALIKALLRI